MKLAIMIVIYTAIVLVCLGLMYGPMRRTVDPEWKHPLRIVIPMLIVVIMAAFPVTGAVTPDGPLCWFFQRWGNLFLGLFIYFFGTLLLLKLCVWIFACIFRSKDGEKRKPGRAISAAILIISLAATVILNQAGWKAAHDLKVTNYELPKELLGLSEPLRIVLVADFHIGVNSKPGLYEDMVGRINEQDADLVLVAGDLITSSYGAMKDSEKYASILRGISAKYGTYLVYGNHDVDEPLFGGFTFVDREEALRNPAMEAWVDSLGWTLLEDEVVEIQGVDGMLLAGRRDESKPGDGIDERESLGDLLSGADPNRKILLLQHEPTDLKKLAANGVALSLSGHTHDGQLFPGNVYCRLFTRQSYGLKDWRGAKAIVTSGVGYFGPPIRVGTISEIAVIDLE